MTRTTPSCGISRKCSKNSSEKLRKQATGTVLCLNDYSITRVNSANNLVIRLPYRENVTNSFTLTDCAETQSVITHDEGSPGGGILIDSSNTNESVK